MIYPAVVVAFGAKLLLLSWLNSFSSDVLDNFVELSTPITSFKSLREGLFLLNSNGNSTGLFRISNDLNIYDGGNVHIPPILLHLLKHFDTLPWLNFIYCVLDSLMVLMFININLKFKQHCINFYSKIYKKLIFLNTDNNNIYNPNLLSTNSTRFNLILILIYCFNPLNLVSLLSKSSIIFSNFFLTLSIYSIVNLSSYESLSLIISTISLSISAYLSYNTLFLIIPLLSIFGTKKFKTLFIFLLSCSSLLLISYYLNQCNLNFLDSTYGMIILFKKIQPNIGLWWYFFIEIFKFFNDFFIGVFNIYNFIFIIPITIRFSKDKENKIEKIYSFILIFGIITLTKSYLTIIDFNFVLNLLAILLLNIPLLINYLKFPIVSILIIIHSIILSPIFYYLWIFNGSGNSNFFYAINLVFSIGFTSILTDLVWSYLSLEYLIENKLDSKDEFTSFDQVKYRLIQY
ncbi:GPI-anchor transamidase subunit GAB1 [Ascoidea rubescens DSM 1968]|uniref:PIG-U-domain-containing protein n=1 Tax=Ascoidea rubescens DSM 1968 TaxID=1344418 RepID=A0A1D2VLP4_9ASCO|nr:PIG-U-domain-containing protein [Ascoidea rubescens DSM 1968]ODV62522.1 PIG-U-domain-containing protein [Ascoidea rubescens DSM 1968]